MRGRVGLQLPARTVIPNPHERTPPPPSTPLKGEKDGRVKDYTTVTDAVQPEVERRGLSIGYRPQAGSPSPLPPPPSPTYPKQPHHVDTTRLGKTAARLHADAVHDPGDETDTPGSQPPSVRLEGEKDKALSLYVEAYHIEADDNDIGMVDHDHDTQQSPRRPVGTPDGNEHRPSKPTEPPDEKEGGQGVDDEGVVDKSREVKGQIEGQSEGEDGDPNGGTNDNEDDATSGTTPKSKQVEAEPLADDETSQQRDATYSPREPATSSRTPQDGTYESQPAPVYGIRTTSYGRVNDHTGQSDATETVQSCRGSIPGLPNLRTKGTEARTSTPPTHLQATNYHIG
ncbi:hypothetical protein PAXINDRAFT_18350 [Paxillus involutus ATCC 200175]|uniref:Uncharacterized protein n=1 Tax=Paxillus involutus ATCC 200175 TaxID=664439 RepID=A0A0C9TBT3_PAXIN|nr:hypothetical protein PAXINDRAFT_18350 [Paxillus involutus ATCC 200175]